MKLENPTETIKVNDIDLFERFWSKVDIPKNLDDCWNWNAYKIPKTKWNRLGGYGQIKVNERGELSHRVAYQLSIGS